MDSWLAQPIRYGVGDGAEARREGERLCREYGIDPDVTYEVIEYSNRVVFKTFAQKPHTTSPGLYWTDDFEPTTYMGFYHDPSTGLVVMADDIVCLK